MSAPLRVHCSAEPACLPRLMDAVQRTCDDHRAGDAVRHDLLLLAEEACVNVIRHAYAPGTPGAMTLQVRRVELDGRAAIELTLEDQGRPFDPLALAAPDTAAPLHERAIGGLGVRLIRQLSDRQQYRRDPQRGNVLTVAKFLATDDTGPQRS